MFNRKKVKELQRKIFILENPPKYKVGDSVDYVLFHMGCDKAPETISCTVVKCYIQEGFNAYPELKNIFFKNEYMLMDNLKETHYNTYCDGIGKIITK